MTSPRRSDRLNGIAKHASRRPRTRRPRTRRPHQQSTPRRSRRALTCPSHEAQNGKPSKVGLLSLPDEPLAHIISYLSSSTPSFKAPPAYFLAQTNTRLLQIFRSQLTHITPYTATETTPVRLCCNHLAAVSRLAGEYLRVIHLPEGPICSSLADTCPNVEELSFRDNGRSQPIIEYFFAKLPLKVLQVVRPCRETLEMLYYIASRLDKLVLKDISLSRINPLVDILESKPKEMILDFDFIGVRDEETVSDALKTTVQNIEKLSISMPSRDHAPDEDVETILNRLRESRRERTCKDIFLCGNGAFHLLRYVDSNAKVALGYNNCVFRSNGPGEKMYATAIATSHTPKVDISRVEELTIDPQAHPGWLSSLPPLKYVNVIACNRLPPPPIRTEIATVPIPSKSYEEWNLPTNELRFESRFLFAKELAGVCDTLQEVLRRFKGKTVWMECIRAYELPKDLDYLRPHIRQARYACICFEKKGGDAGTVLDWLDELFSRSF